MRLRRIQKLALAQAISQAALVMLNKHGQTEIICGGKCLTYEAGRIKMIHTTPFTNLYGTPAPYGLDIWFDGKKVFSFWWDPEDIVCFKYGPWMNSFVPGSY